MRSTSIARVGLVAMLGLLSGGSPAAPSPAGNAPARSAPCFVVINRAALERTTGGAFSRILDACSELTGQREERIFDAGAAYRHAFGKPLEIAGYPSDGARPRALWLRDRLAGLARHSPPGSTIVLLGDETALPRWQLRLGELSLTSDAPYCDLDGDGVPDTPVARVSGSSAVLLRHLAGKRDYGTRACILCSEDTRIHLETRAFAARLSRLGYDVAVRGGPDDDAVSASDIIVHFGHGSPSAISNRFGEPFVTAGDMPALPRSPIVFVDGCGTLPVGSPLLRAFLERGAMAYCGATATVQGMTPARFTNELVEHFLDALDAHPAWTIPRLLVTARAAYVKGHAGLAGRLRELADLGEVSTAGDEATHLLTVVEWVYYGDPRAAFPAVRSPRALSRTVVSLDQTMRLTPRGSHWRVAFETAAGDGQAVLNLLVDVPKKERSDFRLTVSSDGKTCCSVDGRDSTVYQHLGSSCRGGHVRGDRYRARYLLPLPLSEPRAGRHALDVHLDRGSWAEITPGTEVVVWPPEFAERIGLRREPESPRRPGASTVVRRPKTRTPVTVSGRVKRIVTRKARFVALDLSALANRRHDSLRVGGGDNASFKTWFRKDEVTSRGVPFRVLRKNHDVLVSPNNTENVFVLKAVNTRATKIHALIWGYNRPSTGAGIEITLDDGSVLRSTWPLVEWTGKAPSFAFDFENTVAHFAHAGITHEVIRLPAGGRTIRRITSRSGTYGLAAVTLEQ